MDKFAIWAQWGDIHSNADQCKRIISAKKANLTPISIDKNNLCGEFAGSSKYKTTLENCTCIDFNRRKLPCKHMYRLAIELGVMNETAASDKTKIRTPKSDRFTLNELVDRVESLSDSQRSLLRDIMSSTLFTNKNEPAIISANNDSNILIELEFVVKSMDFDVFFNHITRYELFDRLDQMNIRGIKRNCKKADAINFVKDNVNDLEKFFHDKYLLNLNSKMEGVQKKLYTYLLRRDCNDCVYDIDDVSGKLLEIEIPHGAYYKDGKVEFPDDEITYLLNKYGKNRCLKM